jgi:CBS domain-containing protein
MSDQEQIEEGLASGGEPERKLDLLVDLFHRINRVIPEGQDLKTVKPETLCKEAIALMADTGFSQLPVVAGNAVLGVFSYRSFAQGTVKYSIAELNRHKLAPGDMPVEEFMEQFEYVRITEEFIKVFGAMDRDNGILIGTPEKLQGILTPMDFLLYLHQLAYPFVLISEIELALRALIEQSVTATQLEECAKRALGSLYGDPTKVPTVLTDMTFDNYRMIIVHGENWSLFEPRFGSTRTLTDSKLQRIGDLRNDVFHFKRPITTEDVELLAARREWLLRKATVADQGREHNGTTSNG